MFCFSKYTYWTELKSSYRSHLSIYINYEVNLLYLILILKKKSTWIFFQELKVRWCSWSTGRKRAGICRPAFRLLPTPSPETRIYNTNILFYWTKTKIRDIYCENQRFFTIDNILADLKSRITLNSFISSFFLIKKQLILNQLVPTSNQLACLIKISICQLNTH